MSTNMRPEEWATCCDPEQMFVFLGSLRVRNLLSARELQRACLRLICQIAVAQLVERFGAEHFTNPVHVQSSAKRALRTENWAEDIVQQDSVFLGPGFKRDESTILELLRRLTVNGNPKMISGLSAERDPLLSSVRQRQSHAARTIATRLLPGHTIETALLRGNICEAVRDELGWRPVAAAFLPALRRYVSRKASGHPATGFVRGFASEWFDLRPAEGQALEILCSALEALAEPVPQIKIATEAFVVAHDAMLVVDPDKLANRASFVRAIVPFLSELYPWASTKLSSDPKPDEMRSSG